MPRLATGHADVGVAFSDGELEMHVHHDEWGEFHPDEVWLKVAASARTAVPSAPAFAFLGDPGTALWILPASQRPDLLFLGLGAEEVAPGVFSGDVLRVTLKHWEGPGHFIVYQLDNFGTPTVWINTRDGVDTNDYVPLPAGGHIHVNWVFSAPGFYRLTFQASGTLVGTGRELTSTEAVYLFDVGELPRLTITRAHDGDHWVLRWLSETNTRYQIQYRVAADSGPWTDLGLPIPGTGGILEEHVEPLHPQQFFRLRVEYNPGNEPGIVARLFIADATNAALSMIDLETGAVYPALFPLGSRARLASTPSSRYCLAVQLDAGRAELFDSGIYVEDHGDHWHYYKQPVRRMQVSLLGANPVHTVALGDWLTLHWDLSGRVDLIHEKELTVAGDAYVPQSIHAGAQHGSAVPFTHPPGRFFAVSKPNPLYPHETRNPLPVGVDIWDLDTSNRVHTATGYTRMHGEAGNGWSAAFGFVEGVLLLWHNGNGWTNYMIPNPPTMPAGYRIGDLRGHETLNHYFGLAFQGETAGDMFVISATDLSMERLALPGDSFAVAYELGPDGNTFNVVLANGDFVEMNARTLQVLGVRRALIAPTTNHSNHGQFHPHVAGGLGRLYVTDPIGQRVVELEAGSLRTLRVFPLPGTPTKITMHGVLVPPTR
ncbi:hypothetical protein G4L39_14480 [Limisphaera ngatamarikiensis]|uniref:Uncharacterized protein n=1 Tax=Limisphaera ngatamarikiensis TaxID=1324935 RepID=A0A6M1S5S5_9BACT|nr:hypothetical protein [Limisphaera ngatamarikiensis]